MNSEIRARIKALDDLRAEWAKAHSKMINLDVRMEQALQNLLVAVVQSETPPPEPEPLDDL